MQIYLSDNNQAHVHAFSSLFRDLRTLELYLLRPVKLSGRVESVFGGIVSHVPWRI